MPRPKVGDERRELILAAFERCVIAKGLGETTLADVAEAAGQPRSLVRYFVGNREDMVAGLVERLVARGESHLEALRAERERLGFRALLDLLMERVFRDESANMLALELWRLGARDDVVRARLSPIYERLVDELARAIEAEGGPTGRDDARDRAFAALSMALGAAVLRGVGVRPQAAGAPRAFILELALGAPPGGAGGDRLTRKQKGNDA